MQICRLLYFSQPCVPPFVHFTSFALFLTASLNYHYRMKYTGTTMQCICQNWYTVSVMQRFYLMVYVFARSLGITLQYLIKNVLNRLNVINWIQSLDLI